MPPAAATLPLVVTSRPEGVPPELGVPPIELGGLELREPQAVEEVLARAGRREEEGGLVRSNIERGKLVDSPFHLGLIADLLPLRSLQPPPDGGEHAVRVALLSAWRSALLGGDTVPEDERRKRAAILDRLDHFAADRLAPESESASVGAAVRPESKWLDAVHAGEWFGVLEVDDEGLHRFKHEVLHAYFASRILLHDRGLLRDVMERALDAPRVQLALVLAAAASRDAVFCRQVCDALLVESAGVADEQRLLRAVAAAEVALTTPRVCPVDDGIGLFQRSPTKPALHCVQAVRGGFVLACCFLLGRRPPRSGVALRAAHGPGGAGRPAPPAERGPVDEADAG
jgi:hypothetical protein